MPEYGNPENKIKQWESKELTGEAFRQILREVHALKVSQGADPNYLLNLEDVWTALQARSLVQDIPMVDRENETPDQAAARETKIKSLRRAATTNFLRVKFNGSLKDVLEFAGLPFETRKQEVLLSSEDRKLITQWITTYIKEKGNKPTSGKVKEGMGRPDLPDKDIKAIASALLKKFDLGELK